MTTPYREQGIMTLQTTEHPLILLRKEMLNQFSSLPSREKRMQELVDGISPAIIEEICSNVIKNTKKEIQSLSSKNIFYMGKNNRLIADGRYLFSLKQPIYTENSNLELIHKSLEKINEHNKCQTHFLLQRIASHFKKLKMKEYVYYDGCLVYVFERDFYFNRKYKIYF